MKAKEKDILTESFVCRYCELDALETYLEEKAEKGWFLEERTEEYCTFRRGEPRRVQVWADVIIPDEKENKERWQTAGWEEIFNDSRIRIFQHDNLRAKPIENDQKKRLKEIHRMSKWSCVFWPIIGVLFFGGLFWLMELWGAWILCNFQTMTLSILVPVMLAACMITVLSYFSWYRKAGIQAFAGMRFAAKRRIAWKNGDVLWWGYFAMFAGGGLLNWLYIRNVKFCYFTMGMLAVILLLLIAFAVLRSKHIEGKWRHLPLILIAVVLCVNVGAGIYTAKTGTWWKYDETEIPVSMEELGVEEADSENTWADLSATPWLTEWYYSDDSAGDDESLYYTVYTTDCENVYDNLLRQEYLDTSWYDFKEVQEDAFQAEDVWFDEAANSWLLTKGNRIVLFEGTLELNDAQKHIIGERLLGDI